MIKWLINLWFDLQTFRCTMKEWLGEGGRPVDSSVAAARALQCRHCVFNQHGAGYTQFTAGVLKRHLEAKMKARLSVLKEAELHTCQFCRCPLVLKIHVPFAHIRAYQREDVRQAIIKGKPDCWQLTQ